MTVKELITQLLDCDMDKEIYIADDVEYEDENGKCNGTVYDIESVEEKYNVYLNFDNRNHRLREVSPTGAESEDKCKNCEYSRNPDYTRCHECKAESEEV